MSRFPSTWASAKIADIYEVIRAKGREGIVPYLEIGNIDVRTKTYTLSSKPSVKGCFLARHGDVLVSKVRPTRGAITFVHEQSLEVSSGLAVLRSREPMTKEWLWYFLAWNRNYSNHLGDHCTGTMYPTTSTQAVIDFLVPIAPPNEQKRIVARLNELRMKLETCRMRIDRIPKMLKRLRQSALAAACTGNLTADWRRKNSVCEPAVELLKRIDEGVPARTKRFGRLWGAGAVPHLNDTEKQGLPKSWTWAKVSQLGFDPEDAVQVGPMSMRSKDFSDTGVPVLNVGCVQWDGFDETKLDHMPAEKAAAFGRYTIRANDILFTRSGTVGRCALATKRQSGWLMTFHLLRVRPNPAKVFPEYLLIALRGSPNILRQTTGAAIGSTRAGFNTRLLADLDIPLPPIDEQREILRKVDLLLSSIRVSESRYLTAASQVESLFDSIVAKAFEGKLVDQDPDEEAAGSLVERLKASNQTAIRKERVA